MPDQPLVAGSVDVSHEREDMNHGADFGIPGRQNHVVCGSSDDMLHFDSTGLFFFVRQSGGSYQL